MSLAEILDKIITEAATEAEEIRSRSRSEAEVLLAGARKETERIREGIAGAAERHLRGEMEKELSRARLEARKGVLSLKKKLLGELIERLPALLLQKPAGEYALFFAEFVEGHSLSTPARLHIGPKDRERYGEGYAELLAGLVRERCPRCSLVVSEEPAPFEQGMLIRAEKVVLNVSLDSLIEQSRPSIEAGVAKGLFSP